MKDVYMIKFIIKLVAFKKSKKSQREIIMERLWSMDISINNNLRDTLTWLYEYLQLFNIQDLESDKLDLGSIRQEITYKHSLVAARCGNYEVAYHELCDFIYYYGQNLEEPISKPEKAAIKIIIGNFSEGILKQLDQ